MFVGEWILVTAAAGGVGIAAVQSAKGTGYFPLFNYETDFVVSLALGARVIAAVGSEAKLDIAKKYGGADHGVLYNKNGWQKEVLKLTGGKGVDVIYDPVGLIQGLLFIWWHCARIDEDISRCIKMHRLERTCSRHWLCRRHNREGV